MNNTVKKYDKHEYETLKDITDARAKSGDIQEVTTMINAAAEAYPELKSNENYKELMNELKSIKSEVKPHEILLVVDSMTGQDAVNVAETFNEAPSHVITNNQSSLELLLKLGLQDSIIGTIALDNEIPEELEEEFSNINIIIFIISLHSK